MHLTKTLFPCAVALLLVTWGVAGDLAPRLGELVHSAHRAAADQGTPAPENPGGPTTDLVAPFLAGISKKAEHSAPDGTLKDRLLAQENRRGATKSFVDPFLARTSGETVPSLADAAVAVDDKMPAPENHGEPVGKLIDPLALAPEKIGHSRRDAIAEVWTPAPENSRGLGGKPIDPLPNMDRTAVRSLPQVPVESSAADVRFPSEPTAALVDPLAREFGGVVRRTASKVDESRTPEPVRHAAPVRQDPPTTRDPLLVRTSAEAIHESPHSTAGSPAPPSGTAIAQTGKRIDPYVGAVLSDAQPSAIGSVTPNRTLLQDNPRGQSTTIIDPSCAAQMGPYYEFTVEALLWRLEPTSGQPMILNPALGRTIRTDDLDLGFQAGPRINMAFMSDEEESIHSFEVGYFGVFNWYDRIEEEAPAGTSLRLPDGLGNVGVTTDFSAANEMLATYEVNLNSIELNVFFGDRDSDFHWAIGPRFIRLEEQFELDSFTAGRFSFYEVNTRNDMWGAQWVGRWRRSRGCWDFTAICKTGIFNNEARQSTLLTDNDRTVVLRGFAVSDTVASFVLDAGINAAYQFNGTWLVRMGYNVFVMDNIGRATDQLDFSNNATSGDRLFFRQDAVAHGLNFGLEARW